MKSAGTKTADTAELAAAFVKLSSEPCASAGLADIGLFLGPEMAARRAHDALEGAAEGGIGFIDETPRTITVFGPLPL